MIISRKILFPVLTLFTLLLVGLFAYIYTTYQAANNDEEQRSLNIFNAAFDSEVSNQEKFLLSTAQEIANNPQIQEAFASQNRERLLTLSGPIYDRLKQNGITEFHFQNPPATSFLRVQDPQTFGDDLSGYRAMVVNVNTNQQPLADLEASQTGLGIHAVVPVFYQNRYIGSLDLGMDTNADFLNRLCDEILCYGALSCWSGLVRRRLSTGFSQTVE